MDLQKLIDNQLSADRAEEMKNSIQLMLGELILKLEAVQDKELSIVFDEEKYKPTGLVSWRGSYKELAIQYDGGGDYCYEQPKPECQRDEFGYHHFNCSCGGSKKYETSLPEKPTVKNLLDVLKLASGKYFIGYKGGDFTMGKTTPIWVANNGSTSGFKEGKGEEKFYDQTVVDILEQKKRVIINTTLLHY